MYIASFKRSENSKARPYQYASTSKQILKAKAKPFPPCTHSGFNDYRPDDYRNYLECKICGSYDHFTSRHNRVIHIRGGVLAESSQSNESSIGVKCNTCGSTVHSTSDHNEFDHFKRGYDSINCGGRVFTKVAFVNGLKFSLIRLVNSVMLNKIGIEDSSRYPPDEFQEDDPSRQYQVDYDVSYYIIPHGCLLTEITQENHVLENDQMISQLTDTPSGNNTKGPGPIIEPLVLDVTQSHILNQASTSFHPAPSDRWLRDQHIELVNIISNPGEGMLTRSIDASASKCIFADFLSEIEPKKVSEALKHQDELMPCKKN
nr:hypothetical protein [Tanacetum cinerariifolium]